MVVEPSVTCAVFGLGKLGSSFAAVLGAAGLPVVGVDLDARVVDVINRGEAPFQEPGLQDAITRAGDRLRATTNAAEAVHAADVSFVIVPTPSDESGRFVNAYVARALDGIGQALATTDRYHVVSITSTVMPGAMDAELAPTLTGASGRAMGANLGFCYNPTFIALGSVIENLTRPDLVLIGESDARAGDLVEGVHRRIFETDPAVRHMNWANAEIAKIAINTFVTTKISFANMLGELCERTPGADVAAVTEAVGDDHRIGHAYLRGATAYGGPCFPRDNVALARAASDVGVEATLAEATDRVNRRQADRLAQFVERDCPPGGTVAILGLAYKPQTNVLDESPALALAARLIDGGHRVLGFDPMVAVDAVPELPTFEIASRIEDCLGSADAIVVTTPAPEFATLPELARSAGRNPVVIDCWRLFPEATPGVRVVHPGRGTDPKDQPSPAVSTRS